MKNKKSENMENFTHIPIPQAITIKNLFHSLLAKDADMILNIYIIILHFLVFNIWT